MARVRRPSGAAMMTIKFLPHEAVSRSVVRQQRIPCLCRVSNDFEILFQAPLPEAGGQVVGWSRSELEIHVVEGVGQYEHTVNGLVTLQEQDDGSYGIVELEMFYGGFGWVPLISAGRYVKASAATGENDGEHADHQLLDYLRYFIFR